MLIEDYNSETRFGEFGDELASREGDDWFRIGNLLGDFSGGVDGISGGYYSAEGHDGKAHHGEEDGVGREKEDDVTFPDAHVGERGGD